MKKFKFPIVEGIAEDWLGNQVGAKLGLLDFHIQENNLTKISDKNLFTIKSITDIYSPEWLETNFDRRTISELINDDPRLETTIQKANILAAELNKKLAELQYMIQKGENLDKLKQFVNDLRYDSLRYDTQTNEFIWKPTELSEIMREGEIPKRAA